MCRSPDEEEDDGSKTQAAASPWQSVTQQAGACDNTNSHKLPYTHVRTQSFHNYTLAVIDPTFSLTNDTLPPHSGVTTTTAAAAAGPRQAQLNGGGGNIRPTQSEAIATHGKVTPPSGPLQYHGLPHPPSNQPDTAQRVSEPLLFLSQFTHDCQVSVLLVVCISGAL